MTIQSLGYIGVNSTDLSQWQTYGTEVLGLQDVTDQHPDSDKCLLLKMDDRAYRMVIQQSDTDSFGFCGWEATSQANMAVTISKLRAAKIKVSNASPELTKQRCVTELVTFADPAGNKHELYWGPISNSKRMISPVGVSGFVTGEMGVGHVVLPAPNFDETTQFFTEILGFGLSDLMNIRFSDDPAEPNKRLWFMHCNQRHHSLALFEMEAPSGCIHAMLEVESIDEVGRCNDRRIAHNIGLSGTLGRHTNDHMLSFYMRSPGNFDIEYGADGRTIDDWDKFTVFESTVPSFWGHDFSVGQG